MSKEIIQKTEKSQYKTDFITATLTTLILITGCQTTGSKQKTAMAHVIAKQEILIDTLVAEREQLKVKSQIRKSETLTTAEAHLFAALSALKQSSQILKEVVKNEQH
ncbi:MAG: hypothetical protein AB7T49_20250 [Oligoflexales bacterium]